MVEGEEDAKPPGEIPTESKRHKNAPLETPEEECAPKFIKPPEDTTVTEGTFCAETS